MKRSYNVYNKRLVFDHLPKTAGQAVNKWLRSELGAGCVTDNLMGDHQEMIRQYGGLYSIISGHLLFNHEGLDPRYQYITLIREPVDRVISWIFFVLNNHEMEKLPELYCMAKDFLLSDGNNLDNSFFPSVVNLYTKHFIRIEKNKTILSDSEKVSIALSTIKNYDVAGLYEEMPEFLADVADLIGIPAPPTIKRVNVTSSRPAVDQISSELRQRIIDLNQLDIQLYNEVVDWKKTQPSRKRKTMQVSPWKKYERAGEVDRVFTTPDIPEVRAILREGYDVLHGQLITFEVDFLLNRQVYELEAGVHIFDENKRWAFGTNSTLQNKAFLNVAAGSQRITHHLIADLPAGKYTAGFAFNERLPEGGQQELAWYGALCWFKVRYDIDRRFAGYSYLPAEITLQPTTLANDSLVVHIPSGSIRPVALPVSIRANEQNKITVEVSNTGNQLWLGDTFRPVNLSCHWYDQADNTVQFDGLRTALPDGGISPGCTVEMQMELQAPASPGRYQLVLTLVQENVAWFEEMGFEPTRIGVSVVS